MERSITFYHKETPLRHEVKLRISSVGKHAHRYYLDNPVEFEKVVANVVDAMHCRLRVVPKEGEKRGNSRNIR